MCPIPSIRTTTGRTGSLPPRRAESSTENPGGHGAGAHGSGATWRTAPSARQPSWRWRSEGDHTAHPPRHVQSGVLTRGNPRSQRLLPPGGETTQADTGAVLAAGPRSGTPCLIVGISATDPPVHAVIGGWLLAVVVMGTHPWTRRATMRDPVPLWWSEPQLARLCPWVSRTCRSEWEGSETGMYDSVLGIQSPPLAVGGHA